MSERKITIAVVGAGSRGLNCYGQYIHEHPDQAKVVAVAEPREFYRTEAARRFQIPPENVFADWKDLLARPKLADAVIIATSDRLHTAPAIKAAERGYAILLEKPMAPTAEECVEIVRAAKAHGVLLAVCHVLRYAPFYAKIKQLIDTGELGEICTIQHLEGVAWWHFAHSFVRGIFATEADASFMLLAKCCHDLDMLNWLIDGRCLTVSSFGHLKHFRRECKPPHAADRCMDCALADDRCPYSAKKFYFDRLHNDMHRWPLNVVIQEMTDQALEKALREGPYGRCVYQCDNDVMDTQIVNLEFEGNVSASFTVSAFTPHGRKIRVMGTKGYLEGQEQAIRMLDFQTEQWTEYDANQLATDITGGHGGGDQALMNAFINAVGAGDPEAIKTGPDVTLESHLIVFAAETARRENRTVHLSEMYGVDQAPQTAS